jgi:hypothetical protein
MTLLSFALAVIPTLFLVRYYYRQDRARPEPKGLVVKVFLFGVLSALVAIPLELLVGQLQRAFDPGSIGYALFKAFVVAGLIEEYLKLSVVRLTAYRARAFDEVMDGVVYTVVAGLGFACLENVLYVLGGSVARRWCEPSRGAPARRGLRADGLLPGQGPLRSFSRRGQRADRARPVDRRRLSRAVRLPAFRGAAVGGLDRPAGPAPDRGGLPPAARADTRGAGHGPGARAGRGRSRAGQ